MGPHYPMKHVTDGFYTAEGLRKMAVELDGIKVSSDNAVIARLSRPGTLLKSNRGIKGAFVVLGPVPEAPENVEVMRLGTGLRYTQWKPSDFELGEIKIDGGRV